MVRTTSARLLMATVSMLALCVSAHAQDATDETPKTTTDQTSDDAAQSVRETTIVLDAISVTASKTGTSVIDAPASISIVDQEELQRRQPDNLGDILRGMPGVEVSGGPRSTVQMPIIRGLTDNRVVIRVDGARANLNVGHKGGLFIDPEVVKQVEVYRGPASTMQGTGALGGVLALTTVDANDMLEPGQNIGARVKAGYTSVGHGMTWNGMAYGRPTDNSDILVSVTRKNTDDFEAGNGEEQPYTDDDYINGLFKAGLDINDVSRLTLSLQRYSDDHELPSAPDGTSTSNLTDRESTQTTAVVGYEYDDSANDWVDAEVRLYGMDNDIHEVRISDGRDDRRELQTVGLEGSNTVRFDLGGGELFTTVGGEVFRDSQEGRRDGEPTPGWFPDAEMLISGVYIDNTYAVTERLELGAGVRFDSFDLSADGQEDRTDQAVSPRFSASYRVTSWMQPYVSYAEAFNAPTLNQLYNDGLHFSMGPGNNNFFVPNPNLDAETAKTWEFGTNFKTDDLIVGGDAVRAKVSYFRNKVEDYIEQSTDIAGGTTTSSNLPEAEIKGFEAELTYDTGVVFAGLAAARIRGENARTGEYLSNISGDKVSVSGGYRFVDEGVEVGGRANMVDAQNRVPDDEDERDGYATFDLFANWHADEVVNGLTVNFGVDNILDQKYRTSAATLYEPGRNVKISASMKF